MAQSLVMPALAATMSFSEFLTQLFSNPTLLITVLLTLGVIFVNGWTDAPNAIATCVSTRCMSPRAAILMAAVFNFLGVLLMTMINANVATTVYEMVDFSGNTHEALVALCAALFAIVIWAVAAWWFGIPTSESHALIAGLSGAAIALHGGLEGINGDQWIKVIYGLVLSTFLGFFAGYVVSKLTVLLFRNVERQKTNKIFNGAQIAGGAAMAFMHGAQDGQKFMAIFLLGAAMAHGEGSASQFVIPIWLMGASGFQSLTFRSFCGAIIGWSIPYWFLLGHAFFHNEIELFYQPFIHLADFRDIDFGRDFQLWEVVTLGYLFILYIVSSIHCIVAGYEDKIRTRAYLHFLIFLNFCIFLFIVLQPALSMNLLSLLLIGISILVGHLFVLTNSKSSNLFLIGSMITLIALFCFNIWTLL